MPLARVSEETNKKIKAIMKKTGWKSFAHALDKLLENIDEEDFISYETEVIIKIIKKKELNG